MRDLFLSAVIMDDYNLLEQTFCFACYTQGKQYDPITGEEPGRILHEWEEVNLNGLKTRFNSCDSTLLFLISTPLLPSRIIEERYAHISMARNWLSRHINHEGLFIEDPAFCHAREYALKATYWKDSGLKRKIHYPVSFLLTQAQALKALRAIKAEPRLIAKVKKALIDKFLLKPRPPIAIDAKGVIIGFSSDILHALYYLEPDDIQIEKRSLIKATADALKTPIGYRTYAATEKDYRPRGYQKGSIWPFEQYFITKGGKKHGLEDIAQVAECCSGFEGYPEYISWEEGKIKGLGHKLQLWTVAYKFFKEVIK